MKTTGYSLYQNYIEIRVYGSELAPYKFPKFLSMRIFALGYIRQMMNGDELHFISTKKAQYKIKTQVGPFIYNNRVEGEEVDKILKGMGFSHSFTWSYDPVGIISKKRVENISTPYVHTHRPAIEQYANQAEWVTDRTSVV